jgi:hypothetical protein
MLAYIFNHQNSDGGLGLHIEGESTMFGTTLNYIAARILGAKPSDDFSVRARHWIINNGGACNTNPITRIPRKKYLVYLIASWMKVALVFDLCVRPDCNTSWAKFWMCVMGVYEWEGLNPLPPEMWLLPDW